VAASRVATAAERSRTRVPDTVRDHADVSLHVLFYESADDVMSRAPAAYPAHRDRLVEYRSRGDLLLVGTFADPQLDGSMAVFRSREAAEEFVAGDPFVRDDPLSTREWSKPGPCGSGTRSQAKSDRVLSRRKWSENLLPA